MDYYAAKQLPETPVSRQLEASDYSTDELARQLGNTIYAEEGHREMVRFWSAHEALLWDRPLICRMLAHFGTDLRQINFRRS